MHRQIRLVAVVLGLMTLAGCCGGPMSPYYARQAGARLSACLNSPICAHHRCRPHGHDQCPPGGYGMCPPACPPICQSGMSSCDWNPAPDGFHGTVEHGVNEYDPGVTSPPASTSPPTVTPPPAAPAESPVPEPVPERFDDASAYGTQDVQRIRWQDDTDRRVVLPGQQVSRSERRTEEFAAATSEQPSEAVPDDDDMELPLIIPAQR